MKSARWLRAGVPLAVLAMLIAGCGGGGSAGGEANDDLKDVVLIDVNVGGTDGVSLNQVILFEFSEQLVGSSVTRETMRIRLSPNNAYQVPGEFNISGNYVEFFPRLPNLPDLSDAGLNPGQTYEIKLPGYPSANTVTNADGDRLSATYKATFATAVSSSPNLFIDYNPDSQPHIVSVNPKDEAVGVPQAITIEMTFSEPLHPATVTTSNISLTLVQRPPGTELSPVRPIPGQAVLEQNRESVIVRFIPDFPLADNGTYLLEVDRRVTDLVGNDLEAFQSTFTIRDEPPVPSEFIMDFEDGSEIYKDDDITIASWNNDVPGACAAIFTAGGGDGTDGDFDIGKTPTLNSSTQAEYNYRVFKVPAGQTLRLTGSKPITILSLANIEIEGTINASGFNGKASESSTSTWQVPYAAGGVGGPGGGAGGDRYTAVPSSVIYSYKGHKAYPGEDGYGTTGTGGDPCDWGPVYNYKYYGSAGGGGGGHGTKGKDGQDGKYPTSYYNSLGGNGGGTGGNSNLDPVSAGGGGGAGSYHWYYSYPWNTGPGTGGGGGGTVILRSASNIEIMGGEILADGGDGGSAGTYIGGGNGGGGAGGGIKLQSLRDITAQGATISAIGGKGGTGGYSSYGGHGGDGGNGRIKMDDADASPNLSGTTVSPSSYSRGTFTASGPGAPSVAQTLWINLGVFDPVFTKLKASDIVQTIPKDYPGGQTVTVEVQGAMEDVFDLGNPDLDTASAWTNVKTIVNLNNHHYSFIRLRLTFVLAEDQELDDDRPFVDRIRIPFNY